MHFGSVFIVLVLFDVVKSCDEETHYMKDNKCCKLCKPGTRMAQDASCEDPFCPDCAEGEYQDTYTNQPLCKRQPSCDPNLNLQKQKQSKTELSPCQCIPDHHCTGQECVSCVPNTVCKQGEKISKNATQTSDTVCERCPNGTFSNQESASTCKSWTRCASGSKELTPGSFTSDRTCDLTKQTDATAIAFVVVLTLVILISVITALVCYCYRKGKTGSISFVQRACKLCKPKNHPQPPQDNVNVEIGQPKEHVNQPQEDTEDLLKFNGSLTPGISKNGMPVIEDQHKSLLPSEAATEPESFSVHL